MPPVQTPAKDHRRSKFREEFDRPNNLGNDGSVIMECDEIAGLANQQKATTSLFDMKAARSESWPWTGKLSLEDSIKQGVSTLRRESYIHIVQEASQKGFAPPPRREIHEYERKDLPSIPESSRNSVTASFGTSGRPQSKRVDSGMMLEIEPSYVLRDRVETLTEELTRGTKNPIIAQRKPKWLSRVESRAENNQLCRDLLMKPD